MPSRPRNAVLAATIGLTVALGAIAVVDPGDASQPSPVRRAVPQHQPGTPPKTAYHPVIRVPPAQPSLGPEDQRILDQQLDALMRAMGSGR